MAVESREGSAILAGFRESLINPVYSVIILIVAVVLALFCTTSTAQSSFMKQQCIFEDGEMRNSMFTEKNRIPSTTVQNPRGKKMSIEFCRKRRRLITKLLWIRTADIQLYDTRKSETT